MGERDREVAMGAGRDERELWALEAQLRAEDPGYAARFDAGARRLEAQGGDGPRTEPVPRGAVAVVCAAFAFGLLMLVLVPLMVLAG
ncbi:DUF3040 domain-containing protein [Nocardiopsis sp. RSe5-2]|uniref:DUF3040 domain-containing protein n=1 Tax=Nocardiopsis endophytica TaxID=3018445 RepID=A0ABT4U7B7_9ACTN|nr:DUF3040 domain-containing protein [Nocardiopsis endophytica]MDA2812853.1 DUF3040 domain-containing protein [Nocardiopsis endophytica]